jgi:chorismate synthase
MGFRFLTAGESHGKALMGILEGLPSGVSLSKELLSKEMKRRKMGYGRGARQQIETDEFEILTGLRHGKTLGSPIGILLNNKDWSNWEKIMDPWAEPSGDIDKKEVKVPRPGHADYVGGIKYNHRDMRNVLERSSARETAMRVACGSIARFFLLELGIEIGSRVTRIGSVSDDSFYENLFLKQDQIDSSPVRVIDKNIELQMIEEIEKAKKSGDTLGGVFEVQIEGAPIGLGSYSQWDRRLEGSIAKHFMSLNAIKGFEVGLGFKSAELPGTLVHDSFLLEEDNKSVTRKSNKSGGIEGGMSTSEVIVLKAAMKPLATLMNPLESVNLQSMQVSNAHVERSDVCAVPSAAVIGESLAALAITEAILEKFGGDSLIEIQKRVSDWRNSEQNYTGEIS